MRCNFSMHANAAGISFLFLSSENTNADTLCTTGINHQSSTIIDGTKANKMCSNKLFLRGAGKLLEDISSLQAILQITHTVNNTHWRTQVCNEEGENKFHYFTILMTMNHSLGSTLFFGRTKIWMKNAWKHCKKQFL